MPGLEREVVTPERGPLNYHLILLLLFINYVSRVEVFSSLFLQALVYRNVNTHRIRNIDPFLNEFENSFSKSYYDKIARDRDHKIYFQQILRK